MSYTVEGTIWPEDPVPEKIKALIERFYMIADLNAPEAGPRLADEIFAPNATVVMGAHKTAGSEAIAASRKHAWDTIAKRRHHVMNVFSQNRRSSDLLLIGELHLGLINGKSLRTEFIARIVIAAASLEDEPRFELYQAWTDPTPVQQALKD